MSAVQRGHARERDVKRYLESAPGGSWWVLRSPASKGSADLVALKAGEMPRFIEVKANVSGGPFMNFRVGERADLLLAALKAGAKAELCYWPPHGERRFLPSSEWP
jgi:Holliday junction resolvase